MDRQIFGTALERLTYISPVERRIICVMIDDPTITPSTLSNIQKLYDGVVSGTMTEDDISILCDDITHLRSFSLLLQENTYIPEEAKDELRSLPSSKTEQIYYELATGGRSSTIFALARQLCSCMRPTMTNVTAYEWLYLRGQYLSEERSRVLGKIHDIRAGLIPATQEEFDSYCNALYAIPTDAVQRISKSTLLLERDRMILMTGLYVIDHQHPALLASLVFSLEYMAVMRPTQCLTNIEQHLVAKGFLRTAQHDWNGISAMVVAVTLTVIMTWLVASTHIGPPTYQHAKLVSAGLLVVNMILLGSYLCVEHEVREIMVFTIGLICAIFSFFIPHTATLITSCIMSIVMVTNRHNN